MAETFVDATKIRFCRSNIMPFADDEHGTCFPTARR
jgi:hypothetical protein